MFLIDEVLEEYSSNEMRRLKQICYPILIKIGGLNESDYDDFYSIANYTLLLAARKFDETQNDSFDAFLKDCISRKFKTEMTRRNRDRRIPGKLIDRMDKPLNENGEMTFGESIKGEFDLEQEIDELRVNEKVSRYLETLSPKQKKIAMLIMEGYDPSDIKVMLDMSDKKFEMCLERMGTFDKRVLFN